MCSPPASLDSRHTAPTAIIRSLVGESAQVGRNVAQDEYMNVLHGVRSPSYGSSLLRLSLMLMKQRLVSTGGNQAAGVGMFWNTGEVNVIRMSDNVPGR